MIVVEGGVAGLEAAFIAARRGHGVTLYEESDRLGGQFHMASMAPHKEEFFDLIRYLDTMVRREGVSVNLNTEVTRELLEEAAPDSVVLATGGLPLVIDFPGLESSNWISAHDLIEGEAEVTTETAFVIGGGLVVLETAGFLATQGKRVTVVEMMDELAPGMDKLAKTMLIQRLQKEAVVVHTRTAVQRLTADAVVAERDGEEVSFPAQTVVMAVGVRSNHALVDAVISEGRAGFETHVIGDAVKPRKALQAIQEGFEVGLSI